MSKEKKDRFKRIKIRQTLLVDFEEDGVYFIKNLGYPHLEETFSLSHKKMGKIIKEYKKWRGEDGE
jgi:hypothetical protein